MKKILISLIILLNFLFLAYPVYADVDTSNLDINSSACILVENSTGKVIYEKNSREKMFPASTTKIMTALLAIENGNLTDTTIASNTAVSSISPDYATVYLNKGEELTIEQLLNILLIPSGNVAGNILAEYVSGSIEKFVELMNKRAIELGCINSNYTNPYGLQDNNHYTCAYDLYLVAREAMKYDVFRDIVKKTSYKLAPTNVHPKDDRTFSTTNELIKPNASKRSDNYYYPYAIGIKTGYTSQAKDCLVAAASKDGFEFISVILGAEKTSQGLSARFTETIKLFDFAYENYYFRTLNNANSVLKQIEIKDATKDTKSLDIIVQNQIIALVDKNDLYSTLIPEININENLKAPIFKGDIIGKVSYNLYGVKYESDLLAGNDVKKSYFIYFTVGIGVFLLIIIIFIIFKTRKPKNKRIQYV